MSQRRTRQFMLLPILVASLVSVARGGADDGTPIFDGKTLDGWKGDLKYWRVEDGAITGETTKDNPSKTGTTSSLSVLRCCS